MIAPASRKIGKYEILHKLGRGGMADVYLAQDTAHGHQVALKLIEHANDADTIATPSKPNAAARSLQAHLAAIDPRVVRVYDAGDADGFFFVAMEYIDGQDLAELMRRGPLVTGFAAEVAIAVRARWTTHTVCRSSIDGKEFRGIVHGDIKPKNIRIDARGEVRVLDFGIAKALSLSRRLTRNEFGSVPYASPERLDSGEVDRSSDLWSLAVMLYEMLAGAAAVHGARNGTAGALIRARTPAAPLPESTPEPLRRILAQGLAPDPTLRYPSAAAFRRTWRHSAQGRSSARNAGPGRHAPHFRRTSAMAMSLPAGRTRPGEQRTVRTTPAAPSRSPRSPPLGSPSGSYWPCSPPACSTAAGSFSPTT